MPKHRYLLLRDVSRQRDWAIAVISDVVMVRFGIIGETLRKQELRRSSWHANSAAEAAKHRLQEQLDQSFVVIGTCAFDHEDKVIGLDETNPGGVPVHSVERREAVVRKEPIISWRIQAPSWESLSGLLQMAAQTMQAVASVVWASRAGLPTNAPVIHGWPMAFEGHTGTGPVDCIGSIDRGAPIHALTYLLLLQKLAEGSPVSVVAAAPDSNVVELRLRSVQSAYEACGAAFDQLKTQLEDLGVIPKVVTLGEAVKRRYRF